MAGDDRLSAARPAAGAGDPGRVPYAHYRSGRARLDRGLRAQRGWLPIAERAAHIAETCVPPVEFTKVATVCLRERFARLEWTIGGHNPKPNGASSYVGTASGFVCMACGARGEKDGGPAQGDRILTLCAAHRRLRREDPDAFRQALFPVQES